MTRFVTVNRDAAYLLPPSVEDWLPKDHLARFVVDIVDQLDLSALTRQYRGAVSAAYYPTVMLGLLIYGYATGVYSSRRIEAATYESIAFRYIAANEQPDHDSLCAFRKRFLKEIEPLPEGLSIPEELARREDRLAAIRQAKAQIEARAAERDPQEKDHAADHALGSGHYAPFRIRKSQISLSALFTHRVSRAAPRRGCVRNSK